MPLPSESCEAYEKYENILYGELKMLQPDEKSGQRVTVDTVLLAHYAKLKDGERFIDVGCAHGAVALLLALRRRRAGGACPKEPDRRCEGIDISAPLIELATRNAQLNALVDAVFFRAGDLRDVRKIYEPQSFDVLCCNPPYGEVARTHASDSPARATARQGTECRLEDVVDAARYLLKNRARAYFVIRAARFAELVVLLEGRNVRPKRMKAVYPKPGRPAAVVLVEAVRASRPGLVVEPPLLIADERGEYTPELLEAYRI